MIDRQANDDILPGLREDLELLEGQGDWTGAPTWLIHDPYRNRYYRIGSRAMKLLGSWQPVPMDRFVARLNEAADDPIKTTEVERIAAFLMANSLATQEANAGWQGYLEQAAATRKAVWKRAIHNYLFFRIPLFRPQKFLDLTWPLVAPLFSRWFASLLFLIGIIAIYLASRQWGEFKSTFLGFLSAEGFMIYGASLVFIKAIHELGHAFMAKKHGVAVPVIGIAFIVLMPILYTETTGAHRLKSRARKLQIDLAGIYCELALAVIATLFWVFLPDGPARSVAFSTATVSWVLSLGINLNPFMRFDGYYVLSDAIGFENLQERGFALAKWQVREILFGLDKPAPEYLPSGWTVGIILHAWGTWIYRFFLFLGIALLVYHFFIKIIGIALFIIEICWFILLPVAKEVAVWWANRKEIIMRKRTWLSLSILAVGLMLFIVPWSGNVTLPAMVRTDGMISIHAPDSARIHQNHMAEGKRVATGDVLLRLESPEISERIAQNQIGIEILRQRLNRLSADRQEQSLRLVLEQELAARINEHDGLQRLQDRLIVEAESSGILVNVDHELHPGMWINPETRLAILLPDKELSVTGLVPESEATRISPGAEGIFIPDDLDRRKLPVVVENVGEAPVYSIPDPLFAEAYGGQVPVHEPDTEDGGALAPRGTWYPVQLAPGSSTLSDSRYADTVLRGVIRLEALRVSYAARVGRRIAGVLLREAGI